MTRPALLHSPAGARCRPAAPRARPFPVRTPLTGGPARRHRPAANSTRSGRTCDEGPARSGGSSRRPSWPEPRCPSSTRRPPDRAPAERYDLPAFDELDVAADLRQTTGIVAEAPPAAAPSGGESGGTPGVEDGIGPGAVLAVPLGGLAGPVCPAWHIAPIAPVGRPAERGGV